MNRQEIEREINRGIDEQDREIIWFQINKLIELKEKELIEKMILPYTRENRNQGDFHKIYAKDKEFWNGVDLAFDNFVKVMKEFLSSIKQGGPR